MLTKVLIANRGAIACRIIRTLKKLNIKAVAVYSEADAQSLHVRLADEAICIGAAAANDSYLRGDKILAAAQQTGAQAIHAGYGFLSENAQFAADCAAANIAFIGPTPEQMRAFGLKHTARALAESNGVPLLTGSGLLDDLAHASIEAERIGYPVMLKSTAGGGGIGMRLIWQAADLAEAYASVERLARANFKDAGLYLEKYVEHARHIEVQIFGDGQGNVLALGERDCSVQRRNQKVIEETPAPHLNEDTRQALYATAIRLGQAVNYRSAGTVEFVFDADTQEFYFLEVNTRLQVEHGVTEEVMNIDLVEWMVRLAAGTLPSLHTLQPQAIGASMQVRLYAEDPSKNFQPSAGVLTQVQFPVNETRVDTWVETGSDVPAFYDPMLAKIIVHADSRAAALAKLQQALENTKIAGIETNLDYLRQILADEVFSQGRQTTRYLNSFSFNLQTIDVLEAGVQTTVQDYPARIGYWDVGVPPSGPMDNYSFRLANKFVGNSEEAAGLECTMTAPTLRFNRRSVIAITGAPVNATLDDCPIPLWQAVTVEAGSILKMGAATTTGARSYLAIQGGLDVPLYLGSRSTFTLGQFGGHAGRTLRVGDVLHLNPCNNFSTFSAHPAVIPDYSHDWQIGVLYGPHGAPDFFTDDDITQFFATEWEVHYNSSRTGVRLIGPKPTWARQDGGEAGLHPSNIHDNAYAIGAIDFTGDMPVILGPDGPSLGGFVCPAVVVAAELWKLGQLRAGDKIRFVPLSYQQALDLEQAQQHTLVTLTQPLATIDDSPAALESPILLHLPADDGKVQVVYRQAGDKYLLVEYGDLVLDLNLRFRAHALMQWIQQRQLTGIIDLTPGIRSLQIHFDTAHISREHLLSELKQAEEQLDHIDDIEVPSRIVHLPLSWDDISTQVAIEKYLQSVRKDAPWCPSNIEFIRRINGLDSIEQVQNILFEASYLVMGLGDVYLGAPVATPIDPRHRLVTTKYNPARTWTPENAVGIGGAYLCVYGMEGPGGYQFVGRTLQMWNRYRQTDAFTDGKPWLLRFFDQIRFFPVSNEELMQIRADFPLGRYPLKIENTVFKLSDYRRFLADNAESITEAKDKQQSAFDAERERWLATGQAHYDDSQQQATQSTATVELPANAVIINNSVSGNVWKILVKEGDRVKAGDTLAIIESMKMEFNVTSSTTGTVFKINCQEGTAIQAGHEAIILTV